MGCKTTHRPSLVKPRTARILVCKVKNQSTTANRSALAAPVRTQNPVVSSWRLGAAKARFPMSSSSDMEKGRGSTTKTGDNEEEEAPFAGPSVPVIIGMSILSSVSLIMVNKVVMKSFGFQFVLTLTTFHFLCTWGAMAVLAASKVFKAADHVPVVSRATIAAAGVLSIVFMNLSLKYNSVGSYQMFKLACIPCVMVIQYVSDGTMYSGKRMLSLVVLLAGVAFATVHDVELRTIGLVMGVIAVLATSRFQTWQGSKQREFAVNPMQLLHLVAPWQALITGVAAIVMEGDVINHNFQDVEVLLIFVSGAVAISVNLCSMGLIGKTSAVVYQVCAVPRIATVLLLRSHSVRYLPVGWCRLLDTARHA